MFKMREKIITVGLLGTAALIPIDFAMADQLGRASWYSLPQNRTANGERMNPNDLTAAHRSLPFGTRVLVENLSNGRSVVVRINDRGPFTGGRIIDLSRAAAASIGMIDTGVAKVKVSTAHGGALADLGESEANAEKGTPLPAAVKADAAKPKANNDRVAGTAPKPSKAKSATANGKSAKTRTAAAPSSKKARTAPSRKAAGSHTKVKVTAAAERGKASGRSTASVHLASNTNRIRAAAQQSSRSPSGRITVASNTRHLHGKTTRNKKTVRASQTKSTG